MYDTLSQMAAEEMQLIATHHEDLVAATLRTDDVPTILAHLDALANLRSRYAALATQETDNDHS